MGTGSDPSRVAVGAEQAQLHGCLPAEWPETSVLPYDRYLWSWMGSLEPLCPCPGGCRTPGLYETVVRPFPWLHPRSRTVSSRNLREGAADGMLLAGLVVGGNGRQGGLVLRVASHGGVHGHGRFSAAASPSPGLPMGSAPGR